MKLKKVIGISAFNARAGKKSIEGIIGLYGETLLKDNDRELGHFARFNILCIAHLYFRYKDICWYTWAPRGRWSKINSILTSVRLCKLFDDVKVFQGSNIELDHYAEVRYCIEGKVV